MEEELQGKGEQEEKMPTTLDGFFVKNEWQNLGFYAKLKYVPLIRNIYLSIQIWIPFLKSVPFLWSYRF